MKIVKIADSVEVELYVIRNVDGKKLRIPIEVNDEASLRKTQIPNGVIMVKAYGKDDEKQFKALWNKKYRYKNRNYLETAQTIEELLPKLEKR